MRIEQLIHGISEHPIKGRTTARTLGLCNDRHGSSKLCKTTSWSNHYLQLSSGLQKTLARVCVGEGGTKVPGEGLTNRYASITRASAGAPIDSQ
ncbi:hypothetical protein A6X21_11355 [Planctopirus hydrillae]|uniref:Uncharacterized protein n=1 Tax=Planctopirus hydrillae TaxID=1841610 RepID=A0A1C3E6G0_9PLAN|nr:hypothetical protein A6X21_11355 [Planctopirus hydrillae]